MLAMPSQTKTGRALICWRELWLRTCKKQSGELGQGINGRTEVVGLNSGGYRTNIRVGETFIFESFLVEDGETLLRWIFRQPASCEGNERKFC